MESGYHGRAAFGHGNKTSTIKKEDQDQSSSHDAIRYWDYSTDRTKLQPRSRSSIASAPFDSRAISQANVMTSEPVHQTQRVDQRRFAEEARRVAAAVCFTNATPLSRPLAHADAYVPGRSMTSYGIESKQLERSRFVHEARVHHHFTPKPTDSPIKKANRDKTQLERNILKNSEQMQDALWEVQRLHALRADMESIRRARKVVKGLKQDILANSTRARAARQEIACMKEKAKATAPSLQCHIITYGKQFGPLEHIPTLHLDASSIAVQYSINASRVTGQKKNIRAAVFREQRNSDLLEELYITVKDAIRTFSIVKSGAVVSVGIGSERGRHRSVAFSCELQWRLKADGYVVKQNHRDLGKSDEAYMSAPVNDRPLEHTLNYDLESNWEDEVDVKSEHDSEFSNDDVLDGILLHPNS